VSYRDETLSQALGTVLKAGWRVHGRLLLDGYSLIANDFWGNEVEARDPSLTRAAIRLAETVAVLACSGKGES